MHYIPARIGSPSPHGRLVYRREPEIEQNILFIKSLHRQPRSYRLHLSGGASLFGLAADHTVQDVEIIIPRTAWIVTPGLAVPSASQPGSLLLPEVSERIEAVDWPVGSIHVLTDEGYSIAVVTYGEFDLQAAWIALSEQCFVMVDDQSLRGILVDLG